MIRNIVKDGIRRLSRKVTGTRAGSPRSHPEDASARPEACCAGAHEPAPPPSDHTLVPPLDEQDHRPPIAPLDRASVEAILDELVRPALQADGGNIELVDVQGGDVYVRLLGACHGCPSAQATLHMGVEALLREELPNLTRVVQVD